jgi:hypothetical protein
MIEVSNPIIQGLNNAYFANALISRFNGFHPKKAELFKWIHTTWTSKCKISLCSKGFFIVHFHNHEEYRKTREEGPWF